MKELVRSATAAVLAVLLLQPALAPAQTAAFPSKPVRLIVPYPPGGATDGVGRVLAQKLSEAWGQQVVIDNRPGASGVLGADALVKAPADGYTLMLGITTHVINPSIIAKLPYDTQKDFAPVASFASTGFLMAVHPSVPAHTLTEFIAHAKSKPGVLNYGTVGSAGIGRLAGELLSEAAGIDIRHIPYKGSGPLLTDLLGGQVHFVVDTPNVYVQHVKAGKVRPLAVTGKSRLAALPTVPTFTEAGLPAFDVRMWFGIFAPGGTPPDIVNRISADIARAMALPETRAKLESQEFTPFVTTPAQFAAFLQTEAAHYARIVKAAGIKED